MEWLHEMIFEMDWKQFIPSLIATVIGIFGPFWIQSRIEKSKQKRDALDKVKQIKSELEDILTTIRSLNVNERRYIDPIKTPVWTGVQNTSELSLLYILRKKPRIEKMKETLQSFAPNDEKWVQKNMAIIKNSTKQNEEEISERTDDAIEATNGLIQLESWYKAVCTLYGLIDEYNKWWNLYSTQRATGLVPEKLEPERTSIVALAIKLCINWDISENGESTDQINKEGIPFLLELLNEIIAVNTSILRKMLNNVHKFLKRMTKKQKSK